MIRQTSERTILTITALVMTWTSINGQGQQIVSRTTPASCHEICDGSVQFNLDHSRGDVKYFWKSMEDNQYRPLSSNFLLGICPAQYRVRKMTSNQDYLESYSPGEAMEGYAPMTAYKFSTLGKREITLVLDFDQLMNHMNYYVTSVYTSDQGLTWRSSSQLHQAIDKGDAESRFTLDLPRSYENKEEVIVEFFKRESEVESQLNIKILQAQLRSKTYEEYTFEISEKESIHVQSTVSNESDGGDGYIALEVSHGTPPYRYTWDDQEGVSKKESLYAGRYQVKVIDSKGCSVSAEYLIEKPEDTDSEPDMNLSKTSSSDVFHMSIRNYYRQRIHLSIADTSGVYIREFQINPLYDDLDMDLELKDIPPGVFIATFSTEDFSKNIELQID